MKDSFLDQQWRELKERLQACAHHIAAGDSALTAQFAEQASALESNDPPDRYPVLLDRVREAASLAVQWQSLRDSRISPRATYLAANAGNPLAGAG